MNQATPIKLRQMRTLYFGGTYFPGKKITTIKCTVINMLLNGALNFDGSIDLTKVQNIPKTDLWIYIFYLWKKNKENIEVFGRMSDPDDIETPSELAFVNVVKSELETVIIDEEKQIYHTPEEYLSKKDLGMFLNLIMKRYAASMNMQILVNMYTQVIKQFEKKDTELQKKYAELDALHQAAMSTQPITIRTSTANARPTNSRMTVTVELKDGLLEEVK
jgi:hypothetical protein